MLQQADRFQNDIKKYNEAIEKIAEGQTKLESIHGAKSKKDGFIIEENSQEEIPFV